MKYINEEHKQYKIEAINRLYTHVPVRVVDADRFSYGGRNLLLGNFVHYFVYSNMSKFRRYTGFGCRDDWMANLANFEGEAAAVGHSIRSYAKFSDVLCDQILEAANAYWHYFATHKYTVDEGMRDVYFHYKLEEPTHTTLTIAATLPDTANVGLVAFVSSFIRNVMSSIVSAMLKRVVECPLGHNSLRYVLGATAYKPRKDVNYDRSQYERNRIRDSWHCYDYTYTNKGSNFYYFFSPSGYMSTPFMFFTMKLFQSNRVGIRHETIRVWNEYWVNPAPRVRPTTIDISFEGETDEEVLDEYFDFRHEIIAETYGPNIGTHYNYGSNTTSADWVMRSCAIEISKASRMEIDSKVGLALRNHVEALRAEFID